MNIKIELHKGDLPENLDLGNVVAVDGEFMGLNVRRDPLCLIQVSSGNYDAHIVQFNRDNYNAPNLVKILANKNIKKLFHYARSDLTHIKYYLKTDVNNIECSKIKSKLSRTFSDNHSLKTLIKLFDREICRQAAGSLRQSSGSLPAARARAAGGFDIRCQAPNPRPPPL